MIQVQVQVQVHTEVIAYKGQRSVMYNNIIFLHMKIYLESDGINEKRYYTNFFSIRAEIM